MKAMEFLAILPPHFAQVGLRTSREVRSCPEIVCFPLNTRTGSLMSQNSAF